MVCCIMAVFGFLLLSVSEVVAFEQTSTQTSAQNSTQTYTQGSAQGSTQSSTQIYTQTSSQTTSQTSIQTPAQPYIDYVDSDSYTELSNQTTNLMLLSGGNRQLFDDILQYNYPPILTKRRGVEWWQYNRIYNSGVSAIRDVALPTNFKEIKIFGSNTTYRAGVEFKCSSSLPNGWTQEYSVEGRSGRDSFIEGVFEQSAKASTRFIKNYSRDHFLALSTQVPYSMRGLRSSATSECFELTHNNLYNPSWGFYRGEVRNSKVRRNLTPQFNAYYQRSLFSSTTASIEVDLDWATRKVSRLGWYNSSNPMPNYYYKLPSYFYGSTTYQEVYDSWQQNNTDYTQIGWDQLEQINLLSADSEAHYVVEDKVNRVANAESKVLFSSRMQDDSAPYDLTVSYGARYQYSNSRKYKQMRDLLGADYLLDIDQYASDYDQTGNDLQNDLRNPNRKIINGDRFGYDFAHRTSLFEAMGGVNYSSKELDITLDATFGNHSTTRHGYYEKERFASSGSFGDSPTIKLSTYNISTCVEYLFGGRHRVGVSGGVDATSPIAKYLFIAEQNSNRVVESPTTEKMSHLALSYSLSTSMVSLSAQAYILSVGDLTQVWEGYDDLSSTYCNVVISDIATRSIGVEIAARARLSYKVTLSSTLSLLGAEYCSSPLVRLYDESDMTLIAESNASTAEGFVVGNTPQVTATFGASLFLKHGFVLGVDGAYYGMRYVAPSLLRRTDRVLASATSIELLTDMLTQEHLSDMVDISLSINKQFIVSDHKISIFAKVENLLGATDIVSYAREGNRVLSCYSGYSAQPSSYEYCVGRKFYISASYQF